MNTDSLYERALANAQRIAGVHMRKFHNETQRKKEAGPASRYNNQYLLDGYRLAEAFGLKYFMELFVKMLLAGTPAPKVLVAGSDPAYAEKDLTNMRCGQVCGFDPIADSVAFARRRWGAQNLQQFNPLEGELPYPSEFFNGVWMAQ